MRAATSRPAGVVTRGTTSARRLRRAERWLLDTHPGLVRRSGLCVVDLGFGSVPVTTASLHRRLQAVNPTACVIGLEIDPGRVLAAQPWSAPGLTFGHGGFELAGRQPHLVRAFNVLRQDDEADVAPSWSRMRAAMHPDGLLVEGTCDEGGGLGAWVTLDAAGPRSLTLALDAALAPSAVAARLPKALIHHNVPGEPIHALLVELDRQWEQAAGLGVFSPYQRLAAAAHGVSAAGWPVLDGPARWRRGELTVSWKAVQPAASR